MNSIRLWRPLCRASAVWLLALTCLGSDYSTANRDSLSHFWKTAEAKTRPVTILSFGDSMADSYRSITFYLMQKFEERLGTAVTP